MPRPKGPKSLRIMNRMGEKIGEHEKRIADLEAGIRRAIHLVETIRPLVMWPIDDPNQIYNEEWADASLDLVRDALAGKET